MTRVAEEKDLDKSKRIVGIGADVAEAARRPTTSGGGVGEATLLSPMRGDVMRRSMTLTTVAWLFGSVWATAVAGTPLTNFAKALHASEFQFGILAALPFIASLLSLPASLLTEATGQRKRIFHWGLYFQRFMWLPIALVPLWVVRVYGRDVSPIAMVMFLTLVFVMHCGQAVGGPAWVSWMADIVPGRSRGKYFARRRQWGIMTAVPTALLVGWLLDQKTNGVGDEEMMWWCGLVFIVAAVFGAMDIGTFHWVPEIPKPPQRGLHVFAAMKKPLRDRNFLWFGGFVATLTFAVSFMGQFVTLYVIEQALAGGGKESASVNTITQLMVLIAPALAQLLVFSVWGKAVDRMGKRPLLIIAGLGLVPVGLGWCFVTKELIWLGYVLSALGAALWAGVEVANLNLVLEMSGSDTEDGGGGGTGYVAINSVIINVAGCMGGLASGLIAQHLKNIDWQWVTAYKTFTFYDVLFALSAALRLVAVVVFVPHIREAGARPTYEAFRFMSANIYNNVFSAVLQPVRLLGLKDK